MRRSASNPNFDEANGSTPQLHPRFDNFYAASADVQPRGAPSNTDNNTAAIWPKAVVTVVFRPVAYNVIPDNQYTAATEINRYVSKVTEGSSDLQTINGGFKFVSSGSPPIPLDFNPSITVPSSRVTYTWHQVPVDDRTDGYPDLGAVPNLNTIQTLLGSVNSKTINDFPPGTVLFSTWSSKLVMPQTANFDSYYWDISYTFCVRDYGASPTPYVAGEHIGWNYAWSSYKVPAGWDLYTTDATLAGNTLYTYQDLNDLFLYP